MVFGNVQQNTHLGPEDINGIQLKTTDFDHHNLCFFFFIHITDQRITDIPAHKNLNARMGQHFPQKLCGGRLSVSAGYGDDGFPDEPGSQLQLSHYGNSPFFSDFDLRNGMRYPRTQHNQIRFFKCFDSMLSEFHTGTHVTHLLNVGSQIFFPCHIRHGHISAPAF